MHFLYNVPYFNLSYCFVMSGKTRFGVFSTQVVMKSDVYTALS